MENSYFIDSYKPPKLLFNGHLQTIYPALFRKVSTHPLIKRIRIDTPDNDFLDIDFWEKKEAEKVVILSHGLEGSSSRSYITGMAQRFFEAGINVLAWNYRGCSGEMNRQPVFYHSGATYDLDTIVSFAKTQFKKIFLVGFSLGGNISLKYLGEKSGNCLIEKAVAISTPLDLFPGVVNLNRSFNKVYQLRFLNSLKKKAKQKNDQFPGMIDLKRLREIKTLFDFDDQFTSRIHGFEHAMDYYERCSSKKYLASIKTRTLILNAKNDPLLTKESLDKSIVGKNSDIRFLITRKGGHVGFTDFKKPYYWSEEIALKFILS